MSLTGTTAVVTGAGSGIGRAVAAGLAAAGAAVAAVARHAAPLRATADAAPGPGRVVPYPGDVTDRAAMVELARRVEAELGPIRILVNNAGANVRQRRLDGLDPADWDRLIAVNLTGVFNCIHAVLPGMRQRRDGLIVTIASVAGKRVSELGGAAYSASKFAAAALGLSIALEERGRGIRSTVIYPGEVNTPILDQRPEPPPESHRRQILQPEDVAATVVFVAGLPPRVNIPELLIKPTTQAYE